MQLDFALLGERLLTLQCSLDCCCPSFCSSQPPIIDTLHFELLLLLLRIRQKRGSFIRLITLETKAKWSLVHHSILVLVRSNLVLHSTRPLEPLMILGQQMIWPWLRLDYDEQQRRGEERLFTRSHFPVERDKKVLPKIDQSLGGLPAWMIPEKQLQICFLFPLQKRQKKFLKET